MPLPVVAPRPVRQKMWTAFQEASNTITADDAAKFQTMTLENVRQETLDLQNRLAARQSLRNMRRLMPLFSGLEHYSKVVDVLCNGTPFLPWIWAPITLILRLASEYVEAFEQIIKAYCRVGEALQRFKVLGGALSGNAVFYDVLAAFYADILEFHRRAYKFVRRSGWKIFFMSSWGRFQRKFNNILEDMKRHEDLIDLTSNAIDIAEARKMRQELHTWKEESLEKIYLLDKEQSAKEFRSILGWLRFEETEQLSIFELISGQGEKHTGTCSWTHQNAKFRLWLSYRTDTPILWLLGTAGTGKSVISTQLVNFMNKAKMAVVYHICTYASTTSSNYDQILKSLLEQLVRLDGDLAAHVYTDYVLKKRTATSSVLEQLLITLLNSSSCEPNTTRYIWVVLDGVDELSEESPNSQARLLGFVKQIASRTSTSDSIVCKVLVSSRASPTLSQHLRKKPTVSLTDEKECLSAAIRLYASQRLHSLQSRFEQLGMRPDETEEVAVQVAEKANGMFLYARLVLDHLSTNVFMHCSELRSSINQLPQKLSEFYGKILAQILSPLDPRSVGYIKCVLGWIAFAIRPLKRGELLSAVAFSSGNADIARPAPQYILEICGRLTEERSDTTISFIHVSVKEFLQSASSSLLISESEMMEQHTIASISCLLSGVQLQEAANEHTYQRIVNGAHGFHLYASVYWTEHLLRVVQFQQGLSDSSHLYALISLLTAEFEARFPASEEQEKAILQQGVDARLSGLQNEQSIHKLVRRARWASSLKMLEQSLRQETSNESDDLECRQSKAPTPQDGASTLLVRYQTLLVQIFNTPDLAGITAQELENFKRDFQQSVHTCRLASCPRSTFGFETDQLREDHEMSHIQRFKCTEPVCQYPPFVSLQALKRHVRKCHTRETPRKSIRMRVSGSQHPKEPAPASKLRESQTKPDLVVGNGSPSSYDRDPASKGFILPDPSDDLSDLGYVASSTSRQRSLNTTTLSSVPARAWLPKFENKQTEYLGLSYDLFRNLTYEDIVDQKDISSGLPTPKELDSTMTILQVLQDTIERRINFCERSMRLLVPILRQDEQIREEERLRRGAAEDDGRARRTPSASLSPIVK